mmetsp:Transcript_60433/g.138622  ORF Transcript_60433/g.138622 Transcript_60433/m.138622 type:complete len:203 (+) Transcript_60433:354-962(+)
MEWYGVFGLSAAQDDAVGRRAQLAWEVPQAFRRGAGGTRLRIEIEVGYRPTVVAGELRGRVLLDAANHLLKRDVGRVVSEGRLHHRGNVLQGEVDDVGHEGEGYDDVGREVGHDGKRKQHKEDEGDRSGVPRVRQRHHRQREVLAVLKHAAQLSDGSVDGEVVVEGGEEAFPEHRRGLDAQHVNGEGDAVARRVLVLLAVVS